MYVVRFELMRLKSRGSWDKTIAQLDSSLPFVNELDIMAKLGITSKKEFRLLGTFEIFTCCCGEPVKK